MPDSLAASGKLLILMPPGPNAEGAATLLARHGIECQICADAKALCASINENTGAILVADELLKAGNIELLSSCLRTQPPWSDLACIVLTRSDAVARRALAERNLPEALGLKASGTEALGPEALGNLVFLEYPLNTLSLVTAIRSALRARQRQRQIGAYAMALWESEARFRHMADSAPLLIWMTDNIGRTIFVNLHHRHIFSRSVEDIVRSGWACVTTPQRRQQYEQQFTDAFKARTAFSVETQVADSTGRLLWLRCDGVPRLNDNGRFLGYTACGIDITDTKLATQELEQRVIARTSELSATLTRLHAEVLERQQVETELRQSQKMDAIGQLTGGIAHDFNNMLQGVMGCLDLIDRRIDQGRIDEAIPYIDAARRSAKSAAALTHRLLAFARRQTLLPTPVEPDTLINGMSDLIRRTVGPSIKLVTQLGDGAWRIRCDANQLESALLNLCINARDAMQDGGTLTIGSADRTCTQAELHDQNDIVPGQFVEIRVSDTGIGMTQEVMNQAFEPFFTTKPFGQGTGLGLSQLYGFVRQSGGFVRLASTPGIGTTVCLYLPWQSDTGMTQVQPQASVENVMFAANGRTVLVVEDEPDIRTQITQALRDLDYRVVEAEDGNAGLLVVQSLTPIDLLLTDVGLPGLNGRQLADAARERRPGLPVLMITGYPGKALENMGIPQGMNVMGKPFTLNALTARVNQILQAV